MRLIQITINVAIQDAIDVSADAVREVIFRAVDDGLDIDLAFTSNAVEWTDPIGDPPSEDLAAVDVWQTRAREVLDRGRV